MTAAVPPLSEWPEYVGVTEIGDLCGFSRQRAGQIVDEADFPKPFCTVRAGRVWRSADIRLHIEERLNRPKPEIRHGFATTYRSRSCRCEACTEAHRLQHRSLKGRPAPSHGISGYLNYGCRCDLCRAAGSAQNRAQRERRKAAGAA